MERFVCCYTNILTRDSDGESTRAFGIYDRALQRYLVHTDTRPRNAQLDWLRSLPAEGLIPGPAFERFESMGWQTLSSMGDTLLELWRYEIPWSETCIPDPDPIGKHVAILGSPGS